MRLRKRFLKYCKPYRIAIAKLFGTCEPIRLNIPSEIYSNFDVNYLCYDAHRNVIKGCRTLIDALRFRRATDCYITVLYEKYI